MSLITEYKDWVDEQMQINLWGSTVCTPRWLFGQKSDQNSIYPMWFQTFWETLNGRYAPDAPQYVKEIGDRFLDICGDEYVLIRHMLSGNTFGQDGDIHDDWPMPEESLTGVLYLNRRWEDNWGGETVVYNREDRNQMEISKIEAGKLIVFDGSNPHIGKGPQRVCGDLRCIIAMQAVKEDAWRKLIDKNKKKS